MSEDIKQLAHSLLNRSGKMHTPHQGAGVENQKLHQQALPHHVLVHAHEYVGKIMKAKGFL